MSQWAGYGGQAPGGPQNGFQRVSRPGLDGFLEKLGARVDRRAEPRLGIALAAVGMLMVLFGILIWAGERILEVDLDIDGSDPDRTLGIVLSLAVIVVGYAALLWARKGPLATAGVIASALGVPIMLGFATYDPVDPIEVITDFGDDLTTTLPWVLPVGVDAIALVSVGAWLLSFAFVPWARGRTFYLTASTVMLWLYLLEKVEEGAAGWILTLPFSWLLWPFVTAFEGEGFGPEPPDPKVIGVLSVFVAALLYSGAYLLDRSGRRGVATPFAGTALPIAVIGLGHLAGDLKEIGLGLVLLVSGPLLAYYGATQGRRITTWVWSLAAGLGVLLIVSWVFDDSTAGFGAAAVVLGLTTVGLAQMLADYFSEPDEMDPGPSRFTPRRPGPPPQWSAYAGMTTYSYQDQPRPQSSNQPSRF